MSFITSYFKRLLSFLKIRPTAAGLEVSDQVLRLAYSDRKGWHLEAVRLAPGVMDKGRIKDAAAFDAALHDLRSRVPFAKGKKKKMNVFVSLSSVNMYSQVFTLPMMEGKEFEKAVDLNVQMLSPVDISQAYSGWQLLSRDEINVRSEISAAFVEKELVEEMTQALYAAGFITVGVESRALALVRALREKGAGVDAEKSYLLLDIDNSGVDFLVIRKDKLYFEYGNQWADFADDKGQVSVEKFEEVLAASLRQVMNFYTQHWPESLAGIILSAVAFEEQAKSVIAASGSLPVIPMTLSIEQEIPSEWFVAFGSGLRGASANLKDNEINLSGAAAVDTFHEEYLLDFMNLWRVLLPAALGFLIIILILADNFLAVTKASVESQPAFSEQESQAIEFLQASSTAFNQSVALITSAEQQLSGNYLMITDITKIASQNMVTITGISFQSASDPILVTGSTGSENQIVAFKNAIQNDSHFGPANLPLSNIQQSANGGYVFSVTFPLSSGFPQPGK
jgi:hypothetical protein